MNKTKKIKSLINLIEKYSGQKVFIKEFVDENGNSPDQQQLSKEILELQNIFQKDYPTFIENLSTLVGDKKILKFLTAGLKDGKTMDDKFGLGRTSIACKDLHPLQSEVDISKSLNFPLKDPKTAEITLRGENVILGGIPLVTFNKNYIIDGHHRWSQTFCFNPNAQMLVLNLTKANTSPIDALKSTQVAVAAATGDIPVENVEGHNLFTAPREVVIEFVHSNITEEVVKVFATVKGLKTVEEIAEYIWHNCEILQKNNKPIAGAPNRGLMPQTGGDLPGVIKQLVTGKANSMEPFAKPGATLGEALNKATIKLIEKYTGKKVVLKKKLDENHRVFEPNQLLRRAVLNHLISIDDYNDIKFKQAAEEVADNWAVEDDYDGDFGSSDMTYATKEFLDNLGIKNAFINNTLKRLNPDGSEYNVYASKQLKENKDFFIHGGVYKSLVDIPLGGKSNIYPFADTDVKVIKAGTKVQVVIQRGSAGTLYQFYDKNTGKEYGSKWDVQPKFVRKFERLNESLLKEYVDLDFVKAKLSFNKETKTFYGCDKNFKFATTYTIVNPKTGGKKKFEFTSQTGPEFDPNTKYIYKSDDGFTFEVSQDEQLTKQRGDAYLKAKLKKEAISPNNKAKQYAKQMLTKFNWPRFKNLVKKRMRSPENSLWHDNLQEMIAKFFKDEHCGISFSEDFMYDSMENAVRLVKELALSKAAEKYGIEDIFESVIKESVNMNTLLKISENDRITGSNDWDNKNSLNDLKKSGWDVSEKDLEVLNMGKTLKVYSPNGRRILFIKQDSLNESTKKKSDLKETMFISQTGDLMEKSSQEVEEVVKDIFGMYDDIVGENDWGHEFIKRENTSEGVKIILDIEALEELYQIEAMIQDVTEGAKVKCIKKETGIYIIKPLKSNA